MTVEENWSTCPTCELQLSSEIEGGPLRCPICGAKAGPDQEEELTLRELPPPLERHIVLPPPRSRAKPPLEPPPPARAPEGLIAPFAYPLSSVDSRIFLAVAVPVWAVLQSGLVPYGGLLGILFGGWLGAYMFSVLFETAEGKAQAPGAPPVAEIGELLGNFVRFFGAHLVSFAPALLLLLWKGLTRSGLDLSGRSLLDSPVFLLFLGSSLLWGVFYYPMALLLIGFSGSWFSAFNYRFGLRGIVRLGSDYLKCCLFFVATYGLGALLGGLGASWAEGPLLVRASVSLASAFMEIYLYVVQMRVLGVLYFTNREKLGWFRP